MAWFVASACCLIVGVGLVCFWRAWMRPWRDLEQLVQEVSKGHPPRTFLVDGNRAAQRIGLAIENLALRQQELAKRAGQTELNIRAILGAMRDGLAVIDPDGRVRLWNRAVRELFAIDETRLGTSMLETFRDPAIVETVAQTLGNGEIATERIKLRDQSSSGDRQIAVTSLPMPAGEGVPRGAVVLFQDITHLQQLEQVRREFVSNVSHELRTPLSIFRGYVETLLDEPELAADERERILRVMEKHSTRLQSLVNDLLTLARLELPDPQLNLRPLAIDRRLRDLAAEWEKKAGAKDLRIITESEPDLPEIPADEAQFDEIIHNLLDNAVKYSKAGGQITIRTAHDRRNVSISVADEGAGIAPADLPRIFERFYRADKARSREVGGTGLGLAIVKHIAQLHGGSVEAESQLGHGTTIRIILPIGAESLTT